MKIAIIGTGSYGIALGMMLAKKEKNNIMFLTHNEETFEYFMKNHRFSLYEDVEVPKNVTITNSYKEIMKDVNIIFLVTSAKYIKETCEKIKEFYNNKPICIASKGIDHNTLLPLSKLVKNTLKTNNIAVISGPTFAIDLINNNPCALAIAGYNKNTINIIKSNLENETLKLRISSDIIGIQLCGSIKNVIAIAAGILKGLGCQESTESFLINESLHDIKHIIKSLGGKSKTILSFAGVGDIVLTCSSPKSRNYSFGYLIGSTKDKNKIKNYLKENTVEGYYTLESIYKILQKKERENSLITLIKEIVIDGRNPEDLKTFLINKN